MDLNFTQEQLNAVVTWGDLLNVLDMVCETNSKGLRLIEDGLREYHEKTFSNMMDLQLRDTEFVLDVLSEYGYDKRDDLQARYEAFRKEWRKLNNDDNQEVECVD